VQAVRPLEPSDPVRGSTPAWTPGTSSAQALSVAISPPEVILVNGSFGVGKTTVARAMRGMLPRAAIYDPEYAGLLLRKVARWAPLAGSETDDFQDMPAWRRSVVWGTRAACLLNAGPVIVPMTFDEPVYFDEVLQGIRAFAPEATAICLTATVATVRDRLIGRGTDPDGAWIARRVEQCVRAHVDDRFGSRIDTEGRSPDAVAREILESLRVRG
jgi:predicted kinase